MSGLVTTRDGSPIGGVLVITSGMGFKGWAESGADGSFQLPAAGAFVSFRHEGYQPWLVRSSDLTDPIRIQLDPADETVWKLESCSSVRRDGNWIGGGLRINAASGYQGPIYGEHDAHWYIRRGKDVLHLVDGIHWHAGLPGSLAQSDSFSFRGWEYRGIVGLDVAGQDSEGKYWRWVGSPVANAIEYETNDREVADYFDSVIETACFGSAQTIPD